MPDVILRVGWAPFALLIVGALLAFLSDKIAGLVFRGKASAHGIVIKLIGYAAVVAAALMIFEII